MYVLVTEIHPFCSIDSQIDELVIQVKCILYACLKSFARVILKILFS